MLEASRDPAGVGATGADAAAVGTVAERLVRDAALPRCYEREERRHSVAGFADNVAAEDVKKERAAVAVKATADVECRAINVVAAGTG